MNSIQQMTYLNDAIKEGKELLNIRSACNYGDIQEYKEVKIRKKGSTDFIIAREGNKIFKYGYVTEDEVVLFLTSPRVALISDLVIGGPAWFASDVVAITYNTLFVAYKVFSLCLIDNGEIALVGGSGIKKEEIKEETEKDRMFKFFADNGHDEHSPWRRK